MHIWKKKKKNIKFFVKFSTKKIKNLYIESILLSIMIHFF
jgi:hypothetical protein